MFLWSSLPTFAALIIFWLLACYMVRLRPRGLISLTAVAAQIATAAYLLGQVLEVNAPTLGDWLPWARNLLWGAILAPTLWYWVTVLLLREQAVDLAARYLRRIGYPLGIIFAVGSLVLTVITYAGDGLFTWSGVAGLAPEMTSSFRGRVTAGPLYPLYAALLFGTTIGATLTLWIGRSLPLDPARRKRFGWLFVSGVFFLVGAGSLGLAAWLPLPRWPVWLSHLILAASLIVMASNVAAYSALLQGQVIRTDLLYYLTALGSLCLVYTLVFALAGPDFNFRLLQVLTFTLLIAIPAHAFGDFGRRLLDRIFLTPDAQNLRDNLSAAVGDAILAPNLDTVLHQAQSEIAEVSAEHFIRLTGDALRRLNNPAALAQSGLLHRLPHTVAAASGGPSGDLSGVTPLQQAQILREVLREAIERLKPLATEPAPTVTPAALHYHILREAYVAGRPNKQIVSRYSISDSTFHRHRREAIQIVARELLQAEELWASKEDALTESLRTAPVGHTERTSI